MTICVHNATNCSGRDRDPIGHQMLLCTDIMIRYDTLTTIGYGVCCNHALQRRNAKYAQPVLLSVGKWPRNWPPIVQRDSSPMMQIAIPSIERKKILICSDIIKRNTHRYVCIIYSTIARVGGLGNVLA